jgi:hypothetical protein
MRLLPLIAVVACSKPIETSSVNDPPVGLIVGILPDFPDQRVDELRCQVVTPATDLDNDPVTYRFAWTVDGEPFTDVGTTGHYEGDLVPAGVTDAGQVWACVATPNDGTVDGPAASDEVQIRTGYLGWPEADVPAASADVVIAGAPGANLGRSLGALGDVDGDRLDDVILGAPGANAAYVVRGAALGWGGGTVDAGADLVLTGAPGDVVAGDPGTLAAMSDLDGDGATDAAIGVTTDTSGTGHVVLVTDLAGAAGARALAEAWGVVAGIAPSTGRVVGGADTTGDGRDALLLVDEASVYLLTPVAGASSVADADVIVSGATPDSAALADVTGDGVADLLVTDGDDTVVRVFSVSDLGASATGADARCTLGEIRGQLSVIADQDGDDLPELLVVDPDGTGEDGKGDGSGWLVPSSALAPCAGAVDLASVAVLITGYGEGAAGSAIAAADIDGDRLGDFLIGAPFLDGGGGEALLVLASSMGGSELQLDSRPDHRFLGDGDDGVGSAVLAASDLDDDGRDDLAVGAPGRGDGGAVLVFRSP